MVTQVLEIITYVLTVSLATVIPPFTAIPIELIAARRYGLWLSLLFTVAGNVLGAVIAFLLARRFGWGLIEKLFGIEKVRRAMKLIRGYTFWHIVWTRLVFASVFDVLSFVCGLAQISLKNYLLATLIANIPSTYLILALGDKIDISSVMAIWATLVILFISVVLMIKQLRKFSYYHQS